MQRFAFIVHPLVAKDFAKKFPLAKALPENIIAKAIRYLPAINVSHITGIKSPHAEVEGWFIACPLTAQQMLTLPEDLVLSKIIQAGKMAEELGAQIVGLGAFTSVVGDAGVTIAQNLNIAVTTGNSYTVATALEGTRNAVRLMGKDMKKSHVVVLGATGSIGAACSKILLRDGVGRLTLVARNIARLESLAHELRTTYNKEVFVSDEIKKSLKEADVIMAVTSSVDTLIEAEDLKTGAVVCDVSRPRNVSTEVTAKRKDVLVIEGGIVRVPGDVNFGFNFGFPPKTAYACMAETMILALENRYDNFSLGRNFTVEQIDEISNLANKHNFRLDGLRNAEREVTKMEIENIQRRVGNSLLSSHGK